MKRYKTVTVPKTKQERFAGLRCDMCKVTCEGEDWSSERFKEEEVKIYYRSSETYPEGGEAKMHSVHLCPKCFMNKLVPWLENQGAVVAFEEWDW